MCVVRHIFFCLLFFLIVAKNNTSFANTNNSLSSIYSNNAFSNIQTEYNDDDNNIITVGTFSNKDYANIGNETYNKKNPWRKLYAGIDIHWTGKRFGDNVDGFIAFTNFWRRFQNLDAYIGARIFRFFGVEIGYTHFNNIITKHNKKYRVDGMYLSGVVYTPHLDLTYTTMEGYITFGGSMLFGINGARPDLGAKFGGGIILSVLGPVSINLGVDYIYPMYHFAKKGFLTFKTGVNIYLNI